MDKHAQRIWHVLCLDYVSVSSLLPYSTRIDSTNASIAKLWMVNLATTCIVALTVFVTLACVVNIHARNQSRRWEATKPPELISGLFLNFLAVQPTALHLGNLFSSPFLSTVALSQHRFLFQFNKLFGFGLSQRFSSSLTFGPN